MDMNNIISKSTSIKEAKEILKMHGTSLGYGWEITLGMMLQDCDYLEVHDFGTNAYFTKVKEEERESVDNTFL